MLKFIPELVEETQFKVTQDQVSDLISPPIQQILQIIEDHGFQVRIVGGAIRDILMGLQPRDIDLATNALPDQLIFMFVTSGLDIDAFGIRHGTVDAIIDGEKYEITSLDYSIRKNSKGKPIIRSKKDWKSDAERRDYTMNSLSMDLDGNIFDYYDGLGDIHKHIIRALPGFEKKAKEDPNVILRAFKLLAKFSDPKITKNTLKIIEKYKDLLKLVDKDRVRKSLLELVKSPNALKTLNLMAKWGILAALDLNSNKNKEIVHNYKQTLEMQGLESAEDEAISSFCKSEKQYAELLGLE